MISLYFLFCLGERWGNTIRASSAADELEFESSELDEDEDDDDSSDGGGDGDGDDDEDVVDSLLITASKIDANC